MYFQTATKICISTSDCVFHIHCVFKTILGASSHSHLQAVIHKISISNLEVEKKLVYHFYLLGFPLHFFSYFVSGDDVSVTIFVFLLPVY